MQNQNVLTGAVMLETMWRTRKQDLLDLISPFITYGVAKTCAPYESIDLREVLRIVKQEFGYRDMPVSVIERVLLRNPSLFRSSDSLNHRKQYTLSGNLDETVAEINRRREECDKKIAILGEQIADYLSQHVSSKKKYSVNNAVEELQGFFSRNGAFLGTDQLEEHAHELEGHEEDYYIAQYLYEKRDKKSKEYDYVIDLVKGYFLQSAIYLQAENSDINITTYNGVSFYYDTPFILRLLGYKTEEDRLSALDLHTALHNQQAKCFYFPQTKQEVINILNAYKRDIGFSTELTLEGLDELRYSPSDVDRVIASWEQRLKDEFSTSLDPISASKKGIEQAQIDENDLKVFLDEKMRWKSQIGKEADIQSIVAIHKLRENVISEEIENCRAIFVTTNATLSRVFNEYYRQKINATVFPPIITDADLAALTWIKTGTADEIPESQLLRNAYIACQPTPEMLERFGQVLDKMQSEGKVTRELAVAIRTSRYTKKEVLFSTFNDGEGITENVVIKIERMLREEFSQDARDDERYKQKRKRKQEYSEQLKRANKKARAEANKAMNCQLNRERKTVKWIGVVFIVIAVIGLVRSIEGAISQSPIVLGCLTVFLFFSIDSVYTTWKGREARLDKKLVKRATKTYNRILKEKEEEYRNVINDINEE